MTAKELPTVDCLRKRISYCAETGKFYWLDCADMSNNWRAQHAGKEAFVSVCQGYRVGSFDGSMLRAHRVAWSIYYGEWPSGQIDHKNGKRDDNRIENLRIATSQKNARNRAMNCKNTSGVCGVSWHKASRKWLAHIRIDGRLKNLGYFQNIDDAKAARASASAVYGFSERHGTAI